MKKVIEVDPSNQQATRSLFRLEPLAAEKREKMKEEMIGNVVPFFNYLKQCYWRFVTSLWKAIDISFVKWLFLLRLFVLGVHADADLCCHVILFQETLGDEM
jgi:hypothetical protein